MPARRSTRFKQSVPISQQDVAARAALDKIRLSRSNRTQSKPLPAATETPPPKPAFDQSKCSPREKQCMDQIGGKVTPEEADAVIELTPEASFLGIPLELRQKTYRSVLDFTDEIVAIRTPVKSKERYWNGNGLALLAVCKSIKKEIADTFGDGTFHDSITKVRLPRMNELHSRR
jgi:hypothetical protein